MSPRNGRTLTFPKLGERGRGGGGGGRERERERDIDGVCVREGIAVPKRRLQRECVSERGGGREGKGENSRTMTAASTAEPTKTPIDSRDPQLTLSRE